MTGITASSTTFLLFLVICAPILLLGLYVWPSYDDFDRWNMLRVSGSAWHFATSQYQMWTGRFTTEFMSAVLFSQPGLFPFMVFVPIAAFVLLPLGLLATLKAFDLRVGGPAHWVLCACALSASYVALIPHLSDCVFWLTGGLVYVVPLLGSVLWLGALTQQSWPNRLGPILLVGLTVPVALAHEQTSAALIGAGVAYAVIRRRVSPLYGLCFALLIVGSVILIVAPGNFARAASSAQGVAYSPADLVVNYMEVVGSTWRRFVAPVGGGMVVGFVSAFLFHVRGLDRRKLMSWAVVMFAAAAGAVLPLAAVPYFAVSRTAFIPAVFLMAASAAVGFLVTDGLTSKSVPKRQIGTALATGLVAAYVGMAILDWQHVQDVHPQLNARWDALSRSAGSNSDLVLRGLTGTQSPAVSIVALSTDPHDWGNEAMATYFGLRSVRAAED